MNILHEADQIVNHRSQEKERQYGNFDTCMERMRDLFNIMTGNNCTTQDMYMAMIAMKLARQSHAHREDNLLDAAAYMGAMNNHINKNGCDPKGASINGQVTFKVDD